MLHSPRLFVLNFQLVSHKQDVALVRLVMSSENFLILHLFIHQTLFDTHLSFTPPSLFVLIYTLSLFIPKHSLVITITIPFIIVLIYPNTLFVPISPTLMVLSQSYEPQVEKIQFSLKKVFYLVFSSIQCTSCTLLDCISSRSILDCISSRSILACQDQNIRQYFNYV